MCLLSILFICYSARVHLDKTAALVAICDLIALLMLLISIWFTVQKFFYVKLDAILTSISLIFIIAGLVSASSSTLKSDTNHLLYIIVCFKFQLKVYYSDLSSIPFHIAVLLGWMGPNLYSQFS